MININYLAVLVAAIVQIVLGALWYGPLFGKPWFKLMGFTEQSMKEAKAKGGAGMSYGIMSLGALLMSIVLAVFIGSGDMFTGFHTALLVWVGFAAPLTVSSVLWEGKSWKLWFLNAGYYLVGFCFMGLIIGIWH